MMSSRLVLLVPLLAACAAPRAAEPSASVGKLEPAPRPSVSAGRRSGPGALELPLPPKMPLGTGAVPVSSGPVRGSVVTGLRESF